MIHPVAPERARTSERILLGFRASGQRVSRPFLEYALSVYGGASYRL